MSEKLLVEVQGENGAYYKAYVTEVCPEEIRLAFEQDWQPESKFPFSRVRLPPPAPATPLEFHTGQEIEVRKGCGGGGVVLVCERYFCSWWINTTVLLVHLH
jgi:fragile X mental retardation protein